MFDLGWSELLVIGIVALIVVGPKDLPVMFRSVGRFVGKARGMAREFSSAMNEAAEESGARDVSKSLRAAMNPVGSALDGVRGMTDDLKRDMVAATDPAKFDPDSETGKLSRQRAEDSRKIQAAAARRAADRKAREAAEALERAEAAEAAVEAGSVEGGEPTSDSKEFQAFAAVPDSAATDSGNANTETRTGTAPAGEAAESVESRS